MKLNKNLEEAKLDLQVSPLIDVVFLLLIYFIVTMELIRKEGDISFMLPAQTQPQVMVTLPVEVVILILVLLIWWFLRGSWIFMNELFCLLMLIL